VSLDVSSAVHRLDDQISDLERRMVGFRFCALLRHESHQSMLHANSPSSVLFSVSEPCLSQP
jgi:hypothetical protein